MERVNKICPICGNANYVVSLGEFSKVFPYKCINCNSYLMDKDFAVNSGELKEQETTFEKDGHHIRCVKCNSYWCATDREGNAFPMNYCPECGMKAVKWG